VVVSVKQSSLVVQLQREKELLAGAGPSRSPSPPLREPVPAKSDHDEASAPAEFGPQRAKRSTQKGNDFA
jgi:hypothetical protein